MNSQRPALRALAIGLAVLGLCVFAWGLRYKLSLYDAPRGVLHHVQVAKLITGNERRAVPAVDLRPIRDFSALASVTALFFSFLVLRQSRISLAFASFLTPAFRVPVPLVAPRAAIFIRPPPRFR